MRADSAIPRAVDLSHWLGALITSAEIIGMRGITPVRVLIDEAASMVPGERLALCVVTQSGSDRLRTATFGPPQPARAAAADASAETHVIYLDAPVRRVLSIIPPRYKDMWTGAKGFYKGRHHGRPLDGNGWGAGQRIPASEHRCPV